LLDLLHFWCGKENSKIDIILYFVRTMIEIVQKEKTLTEILKKANGKAKH
jgi:hypothetical protein